VITLESINKMMRPTNHVPKSEREKTKITYRINPEAEAEIIQIVKKYTRVQRKELIKQSSWSRGAVCRIIKKFEANKTFKVEREKTKSSTRTFISMLAE